MTEDKDSISIQEIENIHLRVQKLKPTSLLGHLRLRIIDILDFIPHQPFGYATWNEEIKIVGFQLASMMDLKVIEKIIFNNSFFPKLRNLYADELAGIYADGLEKSQFVNQKISRYKAENKQSEDAVSELSEKLGKVDIDFGQDKIRIWINEIGFASNALASFCWNQYSATALIAETMTNHSIRIQQLRPTQNVFSEAEKMIFGRELPH